ncbi:hypothetical protein [Niallia sp. Krafla_26]|uniref:hypothetical protein n=1 Tax=Niallia sp. Krafla_26 TaxID=3064703 RepID=UPI003D167DF6
MGRKRKIYILLTDTGTVLTRMIKFYTKKPYNHASIAFDAELMEVYSFGRKKPKNSFIGGFVKENIDSPLFLQADCAIYSLTISIDEYKKMHQYIQEIASKKDHYHYNFIGLFGVLFKKPIKRKSAFFCSQFVASVLKESNISQFEQKDLSLIKPSDIIDLADFQFVFEGKLEDYIDRNTMRIPCPFYYSV